MGYGSADLSSKRHRTPQTKPTLMMLLLCLYAGLLDIFGGFIVGVGMLDFGVLVLRGKFFTGS